MSIGWVACSARAKAMTRRRLGSPAARDLASRGSLGAAIAGLAGTPYGERIRPGQSLADAQYVVLETFLWNVRVLAGWAPRAGVTALRLLVGFVEIDLVEDRLRAMAGGPEPPRHELGPLATAGRRLATASTPQHIRAVLASSPWGDPGGDTVREAGLGMRTALADRVMSAIPTAAGWAAGATALLVATQVHVTGRGLPERARTTAAKVLGPRALGATTLADLAAAVPASARWALDRVGPDELWRAEARWWDRVEKDAVGYVRNGRPDGSVLVGAVALLAVDAWRTRAAVQSAALGGAPSEVADALA